MERDHPGGGVEEGGGEETSWWWRQGRVEVNGSISICKLKRVGFDLLYYVYLEHNWIKRR